MADLPFPGQDRVKIFISFWFSYSFLNCTSGQFLCVLFKIAQVKQNKLVKILLIAFKIAIPATS